MLNQTPSAFRQLIQADAERPARGGLRYVIFGGEALELASLRPWFDRHGDRQPRLVNMYGITETTVHVTYRPITVDDLARRGAGERDRRPIPDLRVLLLDPHGAPVPIGVAGEIYVGGRRRRARLSRPAELTAERFVPDPFGATGGRGSTGRGDLARPARERRPRVPRPDRPPGQDARLPDRAGRDRSGPRQSTPTSTTCVVIVREDIAARQAARRLRRREPDATLIEQLRATLKRTCRDYMVPAHFVLLAEPATHPQRQGSTAKRSPRPSSDAEATPTAPRAHAHPPRQRIADIWADVARHRPSSASTTTSSNIGGDSLKAAQIVTAIALGLSVST